MTQFEKRALKAQKLKLKLLEELRIKEIEYVEKINIINKNKENYEDPKEKDRKRKAKQRKENREYYLEYNRNNYRKNSDRVKQRVNSYKDVNNPTRIVNRVLKHFDAGQVGAGQFSDRIDAAIELCIKEFNKSKEGTSC